MLKQLTKKQILLQTTESRNIAEKIKRMEIHFQPAVDIYANYEVLTDEQIKIIAPVMIGIEFFQKSCPYNVDINDFIKQCLKHFIYNFVRKGEAVFHHGERGEMFYIILKGVAGVYIPRNQNEIDLEDAKIDKQQEANLIKNTLLPSPLKQGANPRSVANKTGKFASIVECLVALKKTLPNRYYTEKGTLRYTQIEQLYTGQYFGEVALLNDSPRGASIIANTSLCLLSLTKLSYTLVFEQQMILDQQKHQTIQQAFMNIGVIKIPPVFSALFRGVTYNSQEYLWREDDQPNQILILVDGAITYQKKNQEFRHKFIKVCTFSSEAIIGHNELFQNNPKRFFTCITDSICFGYYLPYDQFRNAMRQHPHLAYFLQKDTLQFIEWSEERFSDTKNIIQNPVVQNLISPTNEGQGQQTFQNQVLQPHKGFRTYRIITVRSLNKSQPSYLDLVNSNQQKLSKLQSQKQITQGLNLMYLLQLKNIPSVEKVPSKSPSRSQSNSFISPQLQQSLKHHVRETFKGSQRITKFQGLISSMSKMEIFKTESQQNTKCINLRKQTKSVQSRSTHQVRIFTLNQLLCKIK